MASPQKENGFTPIANELLEAIFSAKLNSTQLKIVLLILRYTYGFSRKEHKFSLNFIARGIGVSRRYVSNELKTLIAANLITIVREHTDTEARVLSLNKNYDTWNLDRTTQQQVKSSSTGEEQDNTTGEELFYTTDEELFTQERKYLKKNLKKKRSSLKIYSGDSPEMKLAEKLKGYILANNPRAKVTNDLQKWAAEFDRILRLDKRPFDEVCAVIEFSQTDSFWMANILSPGKLRKQYDTLFMQSQRNKLNSGRKVADF